MPTNTVALLAGGFDQTTNRVARLSETELASTHDEQWSFDDTRHCRAHGLPDSDQRLLRLRGPSRRSREAGARRPAGLPRARGAADRRRPLGACRVPLRGDPAARRPAAVRDAVGRDAT